MVNATALVDYYSKNLILDVNTTLSSYDGSVLYKMNEVTSE